MKRSSKIIIGFLAAALTYGSLMAFIGSIYGGHRGFNRYQAHRNYHCDANRHENRQQDINADNSQEKSRTDTIK